MKLLSSLFFTLTAIALQAHSLVFVHIGKSLPAHLYYTIKQARLFNPEIPIYLIANEKALEGASALIPATCVACESLQRSSAHKDFERRSKLDRKSIEGFWFYTSERFFYLDELVREKELSDVFHLENDVLLYEELATLLPLMHRHYPNMIAATFEGELRCVPGFLYIANTEPLGKLVQFMSAQSNQGLSDMDVIGFFKKAYQGIWIDLLPSAPAEYLEDPRVCQKGYRPFPAIGMFGTNFASFQSIFDAASFGIYVAGDDPRYHATHYPGVINPNCIFSPAYGTIEWELDSQSRRIPMFAYNGKKWRLNNLHLTNKIALPYFISK